MKDNKFKIDDNNNIYYDGEINSTITIKEVYDEFFLLWDTELKRLLKKSRKEKIEEISKKIEESK